jgi:hypothetical protein
MNGEEYRELKQEIHSVENKMEEGFLGVRRDLHDLEVKIVEGYNTRITTLETIVQNHDKLINKNENRIWDLVWKLSGPVAIGFVALKELL